MGEDLLKNLRWGYFGFASPSAVGGFRPVEKVRVVIGKIAEKHSLPVEVVSLWKQQTAQLERVRTKMGIVTVKMGRSHCSLLLRLSVMLRWWHLHLVLLLVYERLHFDAQRTWRFHLCQRQNFVAEKKQMMSSEGAVVTARIDSCSDFLRIAGLGILL